MTKSRLVQQVSFPSQDDLGEIQDSSKKNHIVTTLKSFHKPQPAAGRRFFFPLAKIVSTSSFKGVSCIRAGTFSGSWATVDVASPHATSFSFQGTGNMGSGLQRPNMTKAIQA